MNDCILFSFLAVLIASCSTPSEEVTSENIIPESQDTLVVVENEVDEVLDSILVLPERMITEEKFILAEADGDLDGDGIPEKAVVFSRDLEWESSAPRDLIIYKQENGQWVEWMMEDNAILHADEGGMMGDPFNGIEIRKGVLEIAHYGGSRWKWGNTDKFRFQNGAFYLIGQTSEYGAPCEYWEGFDYNLSTGKCIYTYEPDVCEESDPAIQSEEERTETFMHKIDSLPTLHNYRDFEYSFESPEGQKLYL